MDTAIKRGKRSAFVREAITMFLGKPRQPLVNRPHLRTFKPELVQQCVVLPPDTIEEISRKYPDIDVSVVIEAAIKSSLRKVKRHDNQGTKGAEESDQTDGD
ncbi:MAG: hypothetical protein VB137_02270 [Burkholderia sp.]